MEGDVKVRRPYNAAGRRERAARDRDRVLDVARSLFLENGYAHTTVSEVARQAEVSPESIYKAFGAKSGLVRAMHERSLLGQGPLPAEGRSDDAQLTAADGAEAARMLGELTAEVAPLVVPLLLVIRTAADGGDASMRELLARTESDRYARMMHNARTLAGRGLLAVGVETAADVMWACTAPELYERLVLRRGWSADRFGDLIGRTLFAALME
jgi:AcrR family transcriptional regulator